METNEKQYFAIERLRGIHSPGTIIPRNYRHHLATRYQWRVDYEIDGSVQSTCIIVADTLSYRVPSTLTQCCPGGRLNQRHGDWMKRVWLGRV